MQTENITNNEEKFLQFFYLKGNQSFLDKPAVYSKEIGISENEYIDCLKILSGYGLIEKGIDTGNTDVKFTSNGINYCRNIEKLRKRKWYEKVINHLEEKNNIYALLISLLALIISIIALKN